jgi:predicted hotdog family 3-hydroxylacyl-ACP dehydratase
VLKDRDWIVRHIPHRGRMCLLDGVLDWSASGVRCVSRLHRSPDNPLRAHGRLGAVCGIEFAAQAMAVHGALIAPALHLERRIGYLAAVRSAELYVARLDDIDDELVAAADRQGGDTTTVLYSFSLSAGGRRLLAGRATVVINPASPGPRLRTVSP